MTETSSNDSAIFGTDDFFQRDNYAPVADELTEFDLTVEGAIPAEFDGWYLRNGPNPRVATGHWFSGDGMIHGIRVEDPGELEAAARDIFAHDGPALLDVVVNRQELSIPPKIDGQQVKGFSLYVLRAVMSGRGDAVLDLAKSNLIR